MVHPKSNFLLRVVLCLTLILPMIEGEARSASRRPQIGPEVITELRVHGNQSLSDQEIIVLAGIAVGDQMGPELVDRVEARLESSGHFETVDVRKRYRSLLTTDEVALIVVVRERPGASETNPLVRSLVQVGRRTMVLPIFDYTEGYGFTYGARVSLVEVFGADGRLSAAANWGGTKQIALEAEKQFSVAAVHHLRGGVSRSRRANPHFEIEDDRTEVWISADRQLPARFRVEAKANWADVRFSTLDDELTSYRLQVDFDTRPDVAFPRDAVFASAGFEWLDLSGRPGVVGRPAFEAHGYKGVFRQMVLVLKTRYQGADGALPLYERTLLGGGSSLRGWKVGELSGDRMGAASAELRFPLDSPLSMGQAGISVFFDAAAIYDVGTTLEKVRVHKGAGAGLFFRAPLIHVQIDVGHNFIDQIRVHATASVTF